MNLLRLAAFSLTLGAVSYAGDPQNISEVFGGRDNLSFITAPDRVDACVLKAIYQAPTQKDDGRGKDIRPTGYEEEAFIAVPPEQLAVLRATLLDETAYRWNVVVGCYPIFHTRVRFHKNEHVLVVDFCFGCHLLAVSKDGSNCGGGLFSEDRNEFLGVMKALFPGDSGLQKRK